MSIRYLPLLLIQIVAILAVSCSQSDGPQEPPEAEPVYKLNTIKDLMDSIVDPSSESIWQSVSTVVSANGVEEKFPQTDEEWKELRRQGVMLLEAANLLQMPGRLVAKPGEKSENPGIELGPEEIQALIDKDRASWNKYAQGLHEATMKAFKAIEEKDAKGLLNVSDQIDEACETCHMHYWYPNERAVLKEKGIIN